MEPHQNPSATGALQPPQAGSAPARAPIPVLKLKMGGMSTIVAGGTSASAPQPAITVKPIVSPVNIPPPIPHTRPAPVSIPAPVPHRSQPQVPQPSPAPVKVLPPLVVKAAGLKVTVPKLTATVSAAPIVHIPAPTPTPVSAPTPPSPVLHISASSTPTPPPTRPMTPSTGTTLGQVLGIPSSSAGGPIKLSSKFVFKVKPSSDTGVAAPVVVAVEQRERLFIRLPRAVVKQELEQIRRRANLKKANAKARRAAEAAFDEHIDVDGDSDHTIPPAKRAKTSASADHGASVGIEGYTPPPEGAVLVPFEGVPNYVPQPDPSKKYIPLKKVLGSTLKQLIQLDRGGFFYDPVTEQVAPGYFEIVKRPMDFVTMRRKIDESRYPFFSLFQYDFEQIIKNCLDYNEEDTPFVGEALLLLRQGREVIAANRLKVQPRQLEAPPLVQQQALEEDEKIRQKDLTNAANTAAIGSAALGDDMDVDEEPQAGRASRAQSQRALAIEEAEEERDLEPQLIRTFPPRRHYVDLPPQPLRPPTASASTGPVLVTVNATNLPVGAVLPPGLLGRGQAVGRPSVGAIASGLQNRAVSLIGPDGKPIITPFNRFQSESAKMLQLIQYRFESSPSALEEYSKSINRFVGESEGWAPDALTNKVKDLLASISDNQFSSPQLWSTSTRMFPKRVTPKAQSRPQAQFKSAVSIPQDLQEQLERVHIDEQKHTIDTLEISDEDKSLLASLQDEIDSELWETLRHVVVKDPEPAVEPMLEDQMIAVS